MLKVRPMQKKDCIQVYEVEIECFSSPWSLKSFENIFNSANQYYFVAIKDGKVVGYIGCVLVLDEADITNVAVLKEYRGKRIGRELLDTLLKYLGDEISIYLEVRKSNEIAIHLYETVGFQQENIRKNYYSNPTEDAIVMCRLGVC